MLTCGNLQEMRFFFRFYRIFGHVVWHVFLRSGSCFLNCVLQRVLSMQLQCSTGPFQTLLWSAFSWDSLRVFLSLFLCSRLSCGDSCFLFNVFRISQLSLRHLFPSFSISLHPFVFVIVSLSLTLSISTRTSTSIIPPVVTVVRYSFSDSFCLISSLFIILSVSLCLCCCKSETGSGGRSWDEACVSLLWRYTLVDALIKNVDRVAPSSRRSLVVAVPRRGGSAVGCLEQCLQMLGCGGVVQGELCVVRTTGSGARAAGWKERHSLRVVCTSSTCWRNMLTCRYVWIWSCGGSRSCTLVCQHEEPQ